jgi:hypothetical protein
MNYDRIDIALGRSTVKPVNKYGKGYVDSGQDVDIWDLANAAATQQIWVLPTQARKHNIASGSANDISALGTLTLAANVADSDTVKIGAKVYTFQTTLTDVDGNVLIGATASDTIDNLIAAINLAAGGGTTYADSTTANPIPTVAAAGAGDTMTVWVGSTASVPTTSTTSATGTLTLAANVSNLDTVTIGTKVYTFVTTLVNIDGYVKIGATASDSIDNLIAVINLGSGSGTVYAASTTANVLETVAAAGAGDTMTLTDLNDGAIATTSAVIRTTGVLTLASNATNGDTVTIGSKVYTFVTTLTNVDGYVKIVASASATIDNLIAAINLAAGGGTTYALSTTANTFACTASAGAGDTMDFAVISAGAKATLSSTSATGTLTLASNVVAGDTVTIGSKVYKFVTDLTQSENDVLLGSTASISIDNLIDAVMLTVGKRGTIYSINASAHPNNVTVAAGAGDTMTLVVPLGTAIATTKSSTHMSWGAATATMGTPAATWGAALTAAITKRATWGAVTTTAGTPASTWGATTAALGTGCRKLRIWGLTSWTGEEVTEDVFMKGAGNAETVNSYVVIYEAKAIIGEFGSGGMNVGAISLTAQTDSTITAYIVAAQGRTKMAIYAVPTGKELLINDFSFSAVKAALGVNASVKLLQCIDPINRPTMFMEIAQAGLMVDSNNRDKQCFEPPLRVSGPALLKIQANSSAADTVIIAGFDGELWPSE